MNLQARLSKLNDKVEQAKSLKDKAEGALEQLKKEILEHFGCSTLEEAEQKLREMNKELDVLEEALNEDLTELEKDFHDGS